MKRSIFIAAAASAISLSRPLLAQAEGLMRPASGWRTPMWYCGNAVVWLNTASGIYYHKGDRWYGQTKSGAYICEKAAIDAGHLASQ
jgi:hypothetical protein